MEAGVPTKRVKIPLWKKDYSNEVLQRQAPVQTWKKVDSYWKKQHEWKRLKKEKGVDHRIPYVCDKAYSEKQRDLCRRESKGTAGIYDSPIERPPPFLNTLTRPASIPFGTISLF